MIRNYLKVALRNISRHKMYSLINICGLSAGLACSILILLWVRDEIGFDRFHEHADVMYRINWDYNWQGEQGTGPGTPPPLAATLVQNVPEIEAAVRLRLMPNAIIRAGEHFYDENGLMAADSGFFELFSFPLVEGDKATVLNEPNTVVLTQSLAQKLFGTESAIGKMVLIDDEKTDFYGTYRNAFRVTGIVRDPPHNSHIRFNMVTSMSSYPEVKWRNWSWVWMQLTTYVKLQPDADPAHVYPKIQDVIKEHLSTSLQRIGYSYEEIIKAGGYWYFVPQPLKDIYLGSADVGNRLGPLGNKTHVHLFTIVAIFLLAIACINFMNLSTAQSEMRAKEIGVRKVLGSQRKSLVGQFLVESMLFSLLALPVAILIVQLCLGPFNSLTGKAIQFNLLDPLWFPGALLLFTMIVGLIAGSYPGFFLSSINPFHAVKGEHPSIGSGVTFRNILVATQFTLTIGLIACTLIVRQQMEHIRSTDLGFDQSGIVVISNKNQRLGTKAEAFRDALLNHPQVLSASISSGIPPGQAFMDSYTVEGRSEEGFQLSSYLTDEHFIDAMGIRILEGRGFAQEFDDSASVMINEAAVHAFGLTDPVGKIIEYPGGNNTRFRIIGVMRDFNAWTLYSPVSPFALFHASSKTYQLSESHIVVKARTVDPASLIHTLESEWKAFAPSTPFEYSFLNENIESQYVSGRRLGKVFLIFSMLTILVSCIGLFGLASFATARRAKEIGIRKILGATSGGILRLLSTNFLKLVLVGLVVATPLSFVMMQKWLQSFAYRIEIQWYIFLIAGAIAASIALLTVGIQSLKTAMSNPAHSLRNE